MKLLKNRYKPAAQIKFEKAAASKARRLLIEDNKRGAVSHPIN